MSEVPLYIRMVHSRHRWRDKWTVLTGRHKWPGISGPLCVQETPHGAQASLQGCLAHKKPSPCRTLQ
jgi:hypothetical protein